MIFPSESWANMARNNEIFYLDKNTSQPFQLMVPKKKKHKKKQPEVGKGFKVGASSRPPLGIHLFLLRVLVFVPPLLCTFFLLSFNI